MQQSIVLTVRVCRVVVVNVAGGPAESTQNNKVSLVFGFPTEASLVHRQKAAVLDGRGAEFTGEEDGVDEHDGDVALLQVGLDLLDGHAAVGQPPQTQRWNKRQQPDRTTDAEAELTTVSPQHLYFLHSGRVCSLGLRPCQSSSCKNSTTDKKTPPKTNVPARAIKSLDLCTDWAPYLVPKTLINAQGLRAEAVPESQVVHEVGQVDGPHTLGQLQLRARLLKVLVTDRMEKAEISNRLTGTDDQTATTRQHLCVREPGTLARTYLRTILEQANPQSQWNRC